ncbi:Uncharacterized protein AXF42_Ash006199 [Apostasia shenzhenica]|uniref:DUF7054 domain-containing protein n=1 Tax=Apostasia shenzhenica TaxID=1088818 RepID=A0A2I0B0H4_9ASPA|nr:Uncharacterized protein AXF42_Ash006199 [Apostasia shenzhenica]
MALQIPHHAAQIRKGTQKIQKPEKKSDGKKAESGRILITVTVLGSAGPIRFVVREDELVAAVMGTTLKTYAREGRRPVLGSDLNSFVLYHAFDGSNALSPMEPIGSFGSRNFLLCKKQGLLTGDGSATPAREIGKKGTCSWKAWLNRSLTLISSQ